jgi:hypothetical protein
MTLAIPKDPLNVRLWDTVDVYTATAGSTLPTDTTTALNAAFINLGLLTEDNVVRSRNVDITDVRSLGGDLVRRKRSGQMMEIGFTAMENSHEVFRRANPGSSATTTTGITTRLYKKQTTVLLAVVIVSTEGANISRTIIPSCEVSSSGDTPMGPTDAYGYPMTITVYPDSTGQLMSEITNDAAASAT